MSERLYLDILAKMGDDWNDTTQAMISIVVGLIMAQVDATSFDIRIDAETVNLLLEKYDLDRRFHVVDGKQYMLITLKRKEVTSNELDSTENDSARNVVETHQRQHVPGDPDSERTGHGEISGDDSLSGPQ